MSKTEDPYLDTPYLPVRVFEDATVATNRTLSRDHQLAVVFAGDGASTNGLTTILPKLPENTLLTRRQVNTTRGYCDHEAGHKRGTDFDAGTRMRIEARATGDTLWPSLANAGEDMRIEKLMHQLYPGTKETIGATVDEVNRIFIESRYPADPDCVNDLRAIGPLAITWEGRRRLGYENQSILDCLALLPERVRSTVEKWCDIIETLDTGVENGDVNKAKSHAACRQMIAIAKELAHEAREAEKKPPTPPAPTPESPEPEPGERDDADGGEDHDELDEDVTSGPEPDPETDSDPPPEGGSDSTEEEEAEGAEGGLPTEDDGDDEAGEGESPEGDGAKTPAGEGEAEAEDETEGALDDHVGDEGGDAGEDAGDEHGGGDDTPADTSEDGTPPPPGHDPGDEDRPDPIPLDADLRAAIDAVMPGRTVEKSSARYPYRPVSRAFDKWHTRRDRPDLYGANPGNNLGTYMALPERLASYNNLVKQIGPHVASIRMKLERALMAKEKRDFEPNHPSGVFDRKRIVQAVQFKPNVYRRRIEADELDTAVLILIDLSGSMAGNKVWLAAMAATAITTALDKANIPIEVLGFTSRTGINISPEHEAVATVLAYANHGLGPDRATPIEPLYASRGLEPIDMLIFKAFNERLMQARMAMGAIQYLAGGNNCDGEALLYAYDRLRPRRERKKVMLVMSDGEPAFHDWLPPGIGATRHSHKHVRDVVQMMEQDGVRCVGIGIQSDAVSRFYPRFTVLQDLSMLSKTVMDQLARLLIGERFKVDNADLMQTSLADVREVRRGR